MNTLCKWLMFSTRAPFRAIEWNEIPPEVVKVEKTPFRSVSGMPGCLGHIDWVRDHSGLLIGVRLWPFREYRSVCGLIRAQDGYSGVSRNVSDQRFIESCRLQGDDPDDAASDMQGLEDCCVYISNEGVYILAVDASWLSTKDVDNVTNIEGTVRSAGP
jgi:hypothetical protein